MFVAKCLKTAMFYEVLNCEFINRGNLSATLSRSRSNPFIILLCPTHGVYAQSTAIETALCFEKYGDYQSIENFLI